VSSPRAKAAVSSPEAKAAVSSPEARAAVREFHRLYYDEIGSVWNTTFWLGTQVLKCPLDLWIYQELIHQTRPDVIIETGTFAGGSALFFASVCQLVGSGRVITIELRDRGEMPQHDLITYIRGSSVAPDVVAEVRQSIDEAESVMVFLDSNHQRDHVLEELRTWAPVVTKGQFLIVEDTNLNGNPAAPGWGPGPKEAVDAFLAESDEFVVDPDCEKFLVTFNPGGYLRRRA
jgi:cephalosporin hydroxylase